MKERMLNILQAVLTFMAIGMIGVMAWKVPVFVTTMNDLRAYVDSLPSKDKLDGIFTAYNMRLVGIEDDIDEARNGVKANTGRWRDVKDTLGIICANQSMNCYGRNAIWHPPYPWPGAPTIRIVRLALHESGALGLARHDERNNGA